MDVSSFQREQATRILSGFLSRPHRQGLIILVGAQNPLLAACMYDRLESAQNLLVVDYQAATWTSEGKERLLLSCGETIPDFQTKLGYMIASTYDLTFRLVLEDSTDEDRNRALQAMSSHISNLVPQLMAQESYFRESAELDMANTFLNIPCLARQRGIMPLHNLAPPRSTAVVVGAGPSLSHQLDWLYKYREQVFIIAAGSTNRAMASRQITPDIYVEIDIRSFEHWQDEQSHDSALVCSPNICPGFSTRFRQAFWFNHNPWSDGILKCVCPELDELQTTFNTGCVSTALAAYMGFRQVVLLGIDLCMSPEGQSHSGFHNQGSDKVVGAEENDSRFDLVENNLGEKCRTLFARMGMIAGFEAVISANPQSQFVQASPKGVKLSGATFIPWSELEPETSQQIALPVDNVANNAQAATHQTLELLKQSIIAPEANSPHAKEVGNRFQRIASWNALFTSTTVHESGALNGVGHARSKLVQKFSSLLDTIDAINESMVSNESPMHFLYQAYREQGYLANGVECDWELELQTMKQISSNGAEAIREHLLSPLQKEFRVASRGTNRAQLQLYDKEKERYVLAVGYYDWMEQAKRLVDGHVKSWQHSGLLPETVLCVGVFDTIYLQILRRYFPELQLVIVEPHLELFAETIRFIPLVSLLGDKSDYLVGRTETELVNYLKNSDTDASTTAIVAPAPECTTFPKWGETYESLQNWKEQN